MKQKSLLLKTIFIVLATIGGASSTWADNVSIPQEIGNYIVIGTSTGADGFASYITKNNCQVDSRLGDATNNKYYTIGSTRSDTKVSFAITAEAGDYAFGFKSGASGCSSVVTVKLTKSGSDTPMFSQDVTIENDGNWDPNISHVCYINGVETAEYILSFDVKEITSGSYAGNFGNFYFHKMSQLEWPTSSTYMELSDGTFKNCRDNNDNVINYIGRTGGYIDDLLIYNSAESYRVFNFNIDAHKQVSKVTITVTNFITGEQEAQATVVVPSNGNYMQPIGTISKGLKKVRFDFTDNDETADDNSYLYNFRQVYFTSLADYALPLTGTAVLNLNQSGVVWNDCKYEDGSSNVGYVRNGSYADGYYVYSSEPAYYNLFANIPWYKSAGTFTMTVTDAATNSVEATVTSSSITATGAVNLKISNQITAGLKRIRFDFAGEGSAYLFNLNNVSFYKRSLNENYNYTPVAATGVDVVLTRTLPANKWATIVLPFAMTSEQITTAFGSNVKVAELTDGDATTLNFTTVTEMTANKPYAIKVKDGEYTSPVTIAGVNVVKATPTQSIDPDPWQFVGTYTNTNIPQSSYFFSNNQLWQATDGTNTIAPFRAYFTYNGGGNARQLNFVIDDGTTAITSIEKGQWNTDNGVYDLQGRRVAQPMKGLYIVNGKKVIIK